MTTNSKKITVEDKINNILSEMIGIDVDKIKPESLLQDDIGADSLDGVEIIMMCCEEEFNIEIKDSEAEKVKTVGDIYNLVKEKGVI